jgi:hypothetical protein
MNRQMSEWLEHVEKFANNPSPTNYLRLIALTEDTMRSSPRET